MANQKILLEPDNYYHIFNRGINSCDIFREESNYEHFLMLLKKYIPHVAECYAWVLLRNHFHMLIKTRKELDILKYQKVFGVRELSPGVRIFQQFSNHYNAYARYFNRKYERTGGLFESNFRRIEVTNKRYLRQLIIYIHNNSVKHRFCNHPVEYPWSSYVSYISEDSHLLYPDNIRNLFLDERQYKSLHSTEMKKKGLFEELEYY